MSVEISDLTAAGMSHCCSASVYDPSGEEVEGICADCKEHCSIIKENL